MRIKGIDQLSKRLTQIAENAKNLNGPHDVPMSELFNDEFMASHTKFSSLDAFFDASGFDTSEPGFLDKIPRGELDSFVADHSQFANWTEMVQSAGGKWAKAQLLK